MCGKLGTRYVHAEMDVFGMSYVYRTEMVAILNSVLRIYVFFFFQAEDGIRDLTVTGVQTCALPIWRPRTLAFPTGGCRTIGAKSSLAFLWHRRRIWSRRTFFAKYSETYCARSAFCEIGRASCRERV